MKMFIFKNMSKSQFFDKKFFQGHPEMNHLKTSNVIRELTSILNSASERMNEIFKNIRDKKSNKMQVDNDLPLLQAIIQMSQEYLWDTMALEYVDGNIEKVTRTGSTVKDAIWMHSSLNSEQSVKDSVKIIVDYQSRLRDLIDHEDSTTSLEQLLESQVNLLKVYHNTPVSVYNVGCETFYPITISIAVMTSILKISDVHDRVDLRKKFMQSEGLKHLFGVSVVDE